LPSIRAILPITGFVGASGLFRPGIGARESVSELTLTPRLRKVCRNRYPLTTFGKDQLPQSPFLTLPVYIPINVDGFWRLVPAVPGARFCRAYLPILDGSGGRMLNVGSSIRRLWEIIKQ
jgi:hypothetical protein